MTTLDPGARDVLTHGRELRPRSTAFLASRPAASMTEGFDVLVQLVMAAMATWPWSRSHLAPPARATGTRRTRRSDGVPAAAAMVAGRSLSAWCPWAPLGAG